MQFTTLETLASVISSLQVLEDIGDATLIAAAKEVESFQEGEEVEKNLDDILSFWGAPIQSVCATTSMAKPIEVLFLAQYQLLMRVMEIGTLVLGFRLGLC